ncbi:MAG: PKD domain-containing protein [Gammaproteobacteria bacterium]
MFDRTRRYGLVFALLMLPLALGACGGSADKSAHSSSGLSVSAGADQTVRGAQRVTLFASSDADNQRYSWTLESKPDASRLATANIAGANSATATLTPDAPGVYVLKVMLDTGHGTTSDTVKVTSTVGVTAGADQTVFGNQPVTLHAITNAINPAYRWSFVSKPHDSKAAIGGADSADAGFTPDASGIYKLQVGVGNGAANDTVTITAEHVWHAGAEPEFNEEQANGSSLALAANAEPYVAYRESDDGGKIHVKHYERGHWELVGSTPASTGEAFYVSLALANKGAPCVAYADFGKAGRGGVTVRQFEKGKWITLGEPGFSGGEAEYISLAAARDGTLYVAYQDFSAAGRGGVTVRQFKNGHWILLGKPGFSPGRATYVSLAIAPNGTPYVAYRDYQDVHAGVSAESFDGKQWYAVGNRGFSAGAIRFVSLAVAPDGTPYVAYEDGGPDHPSSVKKLNRRQWAYVGGNWFTTGESEFNVIAIASDGTPYMAYQDEVHRGASVRKFDGKQWRFVGHAGFSKGEAEGISFAIAHKNRLFISYRDGGDKDKVKVMTFAGKHWTALGDAVSAGDDEDEN